MVIPSAGRAVPHRLPRLHSRQSARCGQCPGQGRLPGAGNQPGWRERIAGSLDRTDRRRQVLVTGGNRTQESRLADIFIACVDGLKGFPEAYVSWKLRREVAADLRAIYTAATVDEAERQLDAFETQ